MAIEVRAIAPEETEAWFETLGTGFLERFDPRLSDEVRPIWDYRRAWAAVEDGAIVGTARTWATELTVPGGACVPASALTGVSVRPTHRRRGILCRILAVEHAAARDRGETLGVLYASEYPIYGRFGYGSASGSATWTWDRRSSAMLPFDDPGSMELVPVTEATRDVLVALFATWRARHPGEIRRRDVTWEVDLGLRASAVGSPWKGWVAVHRDRTGAVDGYVRYHVEAKWEERQARSVLHVDDLHALDLGAERALWAFVGSVDLVVTVRAERRRVAERLPWWLVNGRAAQPSEVGDGLWVRLGDMAAALAARSWESSGSLVLEVVGGGDGMGAVGGAGAAGAAGGSGPAEGVLAPARQRVALEASPEGVTCVATERAPDLTLPLSAVGAAFLGGTRLRDVVLATGVDEHRGGALALADRLFATLDAPWCSTFF